MNRDAPKLGILMGDAPASNMLVVIYQTEIITKWAYVAPGHRRGTAIPLDRPQDFTPLSSFGIHAMMNPDGALCLNQVTISIATYHDGKPRSWNGAQSSKIQINPRVGGYVIEAVRCDFESRRRKAEEISV